MTHCRLAPIVLLVWIIVATLDAWSPKGHRLVALVAANHLSPVARQNVSWLLGTESLADVAVWADEYLLGNNQTSFWHYVNIPLEANRYDRDRDCPRQPGVSAGSRGDLWRDCVVDRIPYNQERLANASLEAHRPTGPGNRTRWRRRGCCRPTASLMRHTSAHVVR